MTPLSASENSDGWQNSLLDCLADAWVQGRQVQSKQAVDLYNMLSESGTNLRQPVGMESQLLKDSAMDSDVAQSMIQLLQVQPLAPPPPLPLLPPPPPPPGSASLAPPAGALLHVAASCHCGTRLRYCTCYIV